MIVPDGVALSDSLRRITKQMRRNSVLRGLDLKRRRYRARKLNRHHTDTFESVHTVCLMLGHVKTGGSLLGAMLDAHPHIVFGDEVDVARLASRGLTALECLRLIEMASKKAARTGRITARRLGGYSLSIPASSQGKSESPQVIGASRAGPTTRALGSDPDLLEFVESVFSSWNLTFIHVVRRPHDSVAAMVLRSGRPLLDAAQDFADQCVRLDRLRSVLGDRVHTVYYEDLVTSPIEVVGNVIEFLGVEAEDDHLLSCGRLIDSGVEEESTQVVWNRAAESVLERAIAEHDFLSRYRPS